MHQAGFVVPKVGLETLGLKNPGNVYWNLQVPALYEEAIRKIMADSPDIWIYNSMQLQGLNKRVKGRRFCTVGQGSEVRWITLES